MVYRFIEIKLYLSDLISTKRANPDILKLCQGDTAVEYAAKESTAAVYNPELNGLLVRMTHPCFC